MNTTGLFISIILLIIVIILIFWLKTPEGKKQKSPRHASHLVEANGKVVKDDLTLVEGIGPKIQILLYAAGIRTFEQLAGKKPYEIQEILHKGNIRIASPDTWADQAQLLADGKMDELRTLQDNLRGGRRM